MPTPDTEQFASALARSVVPVRRIPRLRWVVGGLALLWGLWAGLALAWDAALPGALDSLASSRSGLTVAIGLLLLAGGGALSGLAGCVPGRETAARRGAVLAGLGAALAVVGGLARWATEQAGEALRAPVSADASCLVQSVLEGVLPAVVILGIMAWGAPQRSRLALCGALLGALALGALVIHLECPWSTGRHLLAAHALAPLLAGLPLIWLVREAARRVRPA